MHAKYESTLHMASKEREEGEGFLALEVPTALSLSSTRDPSPA
jgi:hypothetical protein